MTPHPMIYDAANRLVERDGASFSYNADGNLIAGTLGGMARTLQYDELNQLETLDGEVYRYDADGLRVQIERAVGPWTRYVYDPTAKTLRLLEEWSSEDSGDNWSLVARYVHGVGLISRKDDLDNTKLYHYDLRGSTLALTYPGSLVLTDTYAYDPFGKVVATQGSTPNPFTYNGRDGVVDDGTGLYFMRSRYYAPELMRFIQKDQKFSGTLDDPQSLNRYAYVKGDPIRFVDPSGASSWFSDSINSFRESPLRVIAYALYQPLSRTEFGIFDVLPAFDKWGRSWAKEEWNWVSLSLGSIPFFSQVEYAGERYQREEEEEEKAEEERARKAEWSLDNLRKQLDDPNASWNRGLSVPSPAKPSEDPSDRPVPGPAPGGAS
jgi:RHS repeat-associated protein